MRPEDLPQGERLDRRAWVSPPNASARVEEGLVTLRTHRAAPPRWRAPALAAAGVALAAAAAVALWVSSRPATPSVWAGATLETGSEPLQVALSDGSRIEALPATELALLEEAEAEVRVAVRRGGALFEVTREERRDFVVVAGDVEVRVVGTRFAVRHDERRVSVEVERGRVEVRHEGRVSELGAGDRWASDEPPDEPPEGSPDTEEVEDVEPETAEAPVGASEADAPAPRRVDRGPSKPSAQALFEEASEARRAGEPGRAAEILSRLLVAYPRDRRSPLALFELGRLRMDALGDPRGAAEAFEKAVRLGRRSPFQEDALGRLIALYRDLGREAACERAVEAYRAAYPDGAYAPEAARGCR